jgi:hypothetical protein
LRPAEVCRRLLAALDASEGRRRRRKRNTTPDAIGIAIKRRLLEEAVRDDPDAGAFEGWLAERCLSAGEPGSGGGAGELFAASGPVRAMALEVLAEWRLAEAPGAFQSWLGQGAPSDDAEKPGRVEPAGHGRSADDVSTADVWRHEARS